jgi:anti-anti-sigma factor
MQNMTHVVVRRTGPDSCRLVVAGELDVASAGDLRDALRAAVASHRIVVVDLEQLSFCDCSGIGALLSGARAAKARGVELRLRSVPRFLARLIRLSHTSGAFTIESLHH